MPGVDQGVTHSLPETNQSRLNALEALLRRVKGKPCPGQSVDLSVGMEVSPLNSVFHDSKCCNRTGTITDPKLQAAWELLVHQDFHDGSGGYSRDPWEVESWPDGAIRGLLKQVVETIWPYPAELPLAFTYYIARTPKMHYCSWDNSTELLFKAIMEALNEP